MVVMEQRCERLLELGWSSMEWLMWILLEEVEDDKEACLIMVDY